MATYSNILAWRIPWTEESGRLQTMGLQRVGHSRWEWRYERPGSGSEAERRLGTGNVRGKAPVLELQWASSWGSTEPWATLEQGSDPARPE